MSISFDKAFGVHQQALRVQGQRVKLISENLANADTPNFKARDIAFRQALRQAEPGDAGLRTPPSNHLQSGGNGFDRAAVLYRVPSSPSLDGNTVETQREQAKFAEASVQYQTALNFLGSRIQGLIGAIKGE